MSLLRDRMISERDKEKKIAEKIDAEYITPTKDEQKHANEVIKKIAVQFAEELIGKDAEDIGDAIRAAVSRECQELAVSYEARKKIEKAVLITVLGNGPIDIFLQNPDVTEVVVQRYDNVVIERKGKIETTPVTFLSEEHLQTIIKRIVQRVGRQISLINPIVDARLKDGSRINATIPPVSVDGATLTIRKFLKNFLTGEDYIRIGSMSEEMLYFLKMCVKGKISIFISGGTGTGKTTLLNMLSSFIPDDELIITIEDSCELKLQQSNVRRMETRMATTEEMVNVNQTMLVKAALRQRPDRIILGETRDGSIVDIVSAMSTGHEGSISTIHANSPRNMCDTRIPILYSMNKETDFSESAIARQIAEAIQLIIQIARFPDGSRKITSISSINGLDKDGRVEIQDIFWFNMETGMFEYTGSIPARITNWFRDKGVDLRTGVL